MLGTLSRVLQECFAPPIEWEKQYLLLFPIALFLKSQETVSPNFLKYVTPVITLILLNPIQSLPSQRWTFEPESVIRIGRSTDNDVVLYSAVVSRHHVELRRNDSSEWEIISLGANGTYIEGKLITKMVVQDGMIIRLASSGPKIQIRVGEEITKAQQKAGVGRSYLDQSRQTFISVQEPLSEEEN